MPAWLVFIFGVITGALLTLLGVLIADARRERQERQQVTDFERRNDQRNDQRTTATLERLRTAAAEVERQRGEGA